jgi:glycosyltransferase involved in cell wall biosynthesis
MRCPTLSELPPPPPGKTGWPWTIESPQLPDSMPDGKPWPRISIVTPSYNQGQFIEETIRSVLLQGYPNLEYIVMDGGSSDQSPAIIKKYERWLAYWQSEKDGGQVYALNDGFAKCSGDFLNWVNSDDFLHKNALRSIIKAVEFVPDVNIISAMRAECDKESDTVLVDSAWQKYWPLYLLGFPDFPQDATFLSRDTLFELLPLDTRFNFMFDTALYYKMLKIKQKIILIDSVISSIRVYPEMKTLRVDDRKKKEEYIINSEYKPASVIARCVDRLIRTRWYSLVFAAVGMFVRNTDAIKVLRYDPRSSQWCIRRVG